MFSAVVLIQPTLVSWKLFIPFTPLFTSYYLDFISTHYHTPETLVSLLQYLAAVCGSRLRWCLTTPPGIGAGYDLGLIPCSSTTGVIDERRDVYFTTTKLLNELSCRFPLERRLVGLTICGLVSSSPDLGRILAESCIPCRQLRKW